MTDNSITDSELVGSKEHKTTTTTKKQKQIRIDVKIVKLYCISRLFWYGFSPHSKLPICTSSNGMVIFHSKAALTDVRHILFEAKLISIEIWYTHAAYASILYECSIPLKIVESWNVEIVSLACRLDCRVSTHLCVTYF